jgi:hypothetical protein
MDDNTLTLEITCSLWTEIDDDHQTHGWYQNYQRHGSHVFYTFIGLAYQGKDIVFGFNIEYCGSHVDIKTIKGMDLMFFTPLLVLPTKARILCLDSI